MEALLDLHKGNPSAYLNPADGDRIAVWMNPPQTEPCLWLVDCAGPGIPRSDCPGLERIDDDLLVRDYAQPNKGVSSATDAWAEGLRAFGPSGAIYHSSCPAAN
jgi:hypothetical protein